MTVTATPAELAEEFERGNSALVDGIEGCSPDQWQRTTEAEGWTVAATAHHLAVVQQAFAGIVELFADGKTYTTDIEMEQVHKSNAEHAVEFADADRQETLGILRASGANLGALIGGFDAADLTRPAGAFGGNEMTVGEFIQLVVIGHAREHADSIHATLGS